MLYWLAVLTRRAPLRIQFTMMLMVLCAALLVPHFGVPGTFRGVVVHGPGQKSGWIYVAGRHDSLRRVEVSRATVSYDDSVPMRMRRKQPRQALVVGTEVRVTGAPDVKGEWHASAIEILRLAPKHRRAVAGIKTQPISAPSR